MQEGCLRPVVFLRAVFTPRTGLYQHQARKKTGDPSVFQTLQLLARAYALSGLNRRLLCVFFALGAVHVGLGIGLIYDGIGRGQSYITYSLRENLTRGTLVVPMPDIPLDPFRVCLYVHNKTLGLAFGVSVLVSGALPTFLKIRTALTARITDTIALISMVTEVSKYVKHFGLSAMLRAVISDVTVYFFTIFLSHLLLVITIETARVWLRSSFPSYPS